MDVANIDFKIKTSRFFKTNKVDLFFLLTLGITSLFVALIVYFNSNQLFNYVYILPLSTGIMYLLSISLVYNLKNNIISIISLLLLFIRNVVSIFILDMINYNIWVKIPNAQSINYSILLMILESMVIFLTISMFSDQKNKIKLKRSISLTTFFKFFLLLSSIACFFAYILVPEVRLSHTNILTGDLTNIIKVVPNTSVSLLAFRFFINVFPMLQLLVPIYLIIIIWQRLGESILSVFISFVLSLTPLIIISDSSAYSLVVMLAIMLTILKIYPTYRRPFLIILSISFVILFALYFSQKGSNLDESETIYSVSFMLQAYFPGLNNVIGAFNIEDVLITPDVLKNDFIRMLPFRNILFPHADLSNRTEYLFQTAIGNRYQIMPNISMSFVHFGYLAPLMSGLLVYIANIFYQRNTENVILYSSTTLTALYFVISPIMYNFVNIGGRFADSLFWLLIIACFSVKEE